MLRVIPDPYMKEPAMKDPRSSIVAADRLAGNRVVDAKGAELGTIAEVMIDVPRGAAAYAVMSCDLEGMGGKLVVVPWSAFTLDARRRLVLDTDLARLRRAPDFDAEPWSA
jgi:sporulation protein YlmC with PRC-barrel domain